MPPPPPSGAERQQRSDRSEGYRPSKPPSSRSPPGPGGGGAFIVMGSRQAGGRVKSNRWLIHERGRCQLPNTRQFCRHSSLILMCNLKCGRFQRRVLSNALITGSRKVLLPDSRLPSFACRRRIRVVTTGRSSLGVSGYWQAVLDQRREPFLSRHVLPSRLPACANGQAAR